MLIFDKLSARIQHVAASIKGIREVAQCVYSLLWVYHTPCVCFRSSGKRNEVITALQKAVMDLVVKIEKTCENIYNGWF